MLTKQPVSYYQPSVMLTCIDRITKKLSKRVTNRLSHRWAFFFPDAVLTLIARPAQTSTVLIGLQAMQDMKKHHKPTHFLG